MNSMEFGEIAKMKSEPPFNDMEVTMQRYPWFVLTVGAGVAYCASRFRRSL